jgi:hypothetical protein
MYTGLDALVAMNVFGWKWHLNKQQGFYVLFPPANPRYQRWMYDESWYEEVPPGYIPAKRVRAADWYRGGGFADFEGGHALPRFGSDVRAAWLVVSEMATRGMNLELIQYCYSRTYAGFGASSVLTGELGTDYAEGNGVHSTPEAICRAALLVAAK